MPRFNGMPLRLARPASGFGGEIEGTSPEVHDPLTTTPLDFVYNGDDMRHHGDQGKATATGRDQGRKAMCETLDLSMDIHG